MIPTGIDKYRYDKVQHAPWGDPADFPIEDYPGGEQALKKVNDEGWMDAAHDLGVFIINEQIEKPGTHDIRGKINPLKY